MISELGVWTIILLPLLAVIAICMIMVFPRLQLQSITGYISVLSMLGSIGMSTWALVSVINHSGVGPNGAIPMEAHSLLSIGEDLPNPFSISVGVLLDPLTSVMLVMIGIVSFSVQIYSLSYMKKPTPAAHFQDYPRYFAYMSLFTASMFGLVLSQNLIQMFVFWELVGLCSFLLIGFWYDRPAAAAAAKKAFIITRIGDFGFLLALLYLFANSAAFTAHGMNPFDIHDLNVAASFLPPVMVTWTALGIFAGAVGKSAQFPLHTWLPDAMEGPTPVSSLIHAATMVAAGVFLVARMFPLFEQSTTALNTVAVIGGGTAIFAATMGLAATDIKRVLAHSTVSQLGYMMLALGLGAPSVAIFHLINHAFFKCLLFLGAGSVSHATGTFDMRRMGGLRKKMPVTYTTTLIAGISLIGIFPLAGFWSKEEILTVAWAGSTPGAFILFSTALISVFLTALYIFRLIYMTFHGTFRGADSVPNNHSPHTGIHLQESPLPMIIPMICLSLAAIFSGFLLNSPLEILTIPSHWLAHFLEGSTPHASLLVTILSTLLATSGIVVATIIYHSRLSSGLKLLSALNRFTPVLSQRYYFDHLYERFIVRTILFRGLSKISDWFDTRIVDGTVDFIAWGGRNVGKLGAQLQTGQIQIYGVSITLGVITMLLIYLK